MAHNSPAQIHGKSFSWKHLKNTNQNRLRCTKCNNPLLLVIWEPVARKVKVHSAHRFRVIAKCPMCKGSVRITLGPPK